MDCISASSSATLHDTRELAAWSGLSETSISKSSVQCALLLNHWHCAAIKKVTPRRRDPGAARGGRAGGGARRNAAFGAVRGGGSRASNTQTGLCGVLIFRWPMEGKWHGKLKATCSIFFYTTSGRSSRLAPGRRGAIFACCVFSFRFVASCTKSELGRKALPVEYIHLPSTDGTERAAPGFADLSD